MTEPTTSNYWLDVAVRDVLKQYPDGEIIISSGISPSASYHVGHFREIMTADALTWGIKQTGRQVKHVHVVDNFDPLRKRYDFLPESYAQYVGWPICLVPDPFDDCRDEHKTYAEHFYREFETYAQQMGIFPDQIVHSYEDLYRAGKMAGAIEHAVANQAAIKAIFKEVSNRDLPDDWLPLQLLGPNKSFTELEFVSIKTSDHTIAASSEDGKTHLLDYARGEVKLNWRLDWPARWQALGVQVEPFGVQEHGAAGGSYDTGVRFAKEVFDFEPPIPGVQYANIHMLGDTKKMSSSKGNLITPAQALSIMPPEVLRYFVVRSRVDRTLYWDSGQGLFNLVKEFAGIKDAVEAGEDTEFADAYRFAVASRVEDMISSVPFDHLVQVYQAGRGDETEAMEILRRTGYEATVERQHELIVREFKFVQSWLQKYAPDNIKFEVQEKLSEVELSDEQKTMLAKLADTIEAEGDLNGQGMHDAIYAAAEVAGIKAGQAFQAIYRVILGQDSGPKAGWFLASLDAKWLVKRLRLEA